MYIRERWTYVFPLHVDYITDLEKSQILGLKKLFRGYLVLKFLFRGYLFPGPGVSIDTKISIYQNPPLSIFLYRYSFIYIKSPDFA